MSNFFIKKKTLIHERNKNTDRNYLVEGDIVI